MNPSVNELDEQSESSQLTYGWGIALKVRITLDYEVVSLFDPHNQCYT